MIDTKEKILLVAFKLFVNEGYHNTSMQQLVKASKLSKGAFYYYFKSKNELYRQVINRYFLSYYLAVDWSIYEKKDFTLTQIEEEVKNFYLHFVPQILLIANKGMSSYYIMYFEAYTILPEFKKAIQIFYKKLESVLIKATDNTANPNAKAILTISKYEGVLFLMAINPNLEIETLLKHISN